MGRKIPGKKHRGVKDPDQQRAVRYHSIKDKINAPPKDVDQQDIPYSLQKIITLKERLKEGKVTQTRKKIKTNSKLISTEPIKPNKIKRLHANSDPAPSFIQQKGETDSKFLHRVNIIVENVLKESKFEDKYGVKVKRNIETGEVEDVVKQPKDELRELIKKAKKERKQKGKKKKAPDEPRLTKSQKKTRKLAEKKAQKELNKDIVLDFDDYKDSVQFGEIVHAPPTLVTPKKVNKIDGAPRPGRKDLLLKSVINKNDNKPNSKFQSLSTKKTVFDKIQAVGKINKKGKRKDLPQGVRRQLETQQKEIVSAYRMLKAKKEKISN